MKSALQNTPDKLLKALVATARRFDAAARKKYTENRYLRDASNPFSPLFFHVNARTKLAGSNENSNGALRSMAGASALRRSFRKNAIYGSSSRFHGETHLTRRIAGFLSRSHFLKLFARTFRSREHSRVEAVLRSFGTIAGRLFRFFNSLHSRSVSLGLFNIF